jgi:hypothetical protein
VKFGFLLGSEGGGFFGPLFGAINFVLYRIWTMFAGICDVIEDVFYQLAGIKPPTAVVKDNNTWEKASDYEGKGNDIVSVLIRNGRVQTIFQNLIIVAITLIMFFTILQIIREQYKNKDGGNPYMIVFRMFKGMVTMLFVTAAVLVGLQVSGIVLSALNSATGAAGSGASGAVFRSMAYRGNRIRLGEKHLEGAEIDGKTIPTLRAGGRPVDIDNPSSTTSGWGDLDPAILGRAQAVGEKQTPGVDSSLAEEAEKSKDEEVATPTYVTIEPIELYWNPGYTYIPFDSTGHTKVTFRWKNNDSQGSQSSVSLFNYYIEVGSKRDFPRSANTMRTFINDKCKPDGASMTSGMALSGMTFNSANTEEIGDFITAYTKWLFLCQLIALFKEGMHRFFDNPAPGEAWGPLDGAKWIPCEVTGHTTHNLFEWLDCKVFKGTPWVRSFMMQLMWYFGDSPEVEYPFLDSFTIYKGGPVDMALQGMVKGVIDQAPDDVWRVMFGFAAELFGGLIDVIRYYAAQILYGVDSFTLNITNPPTDVVNFVNEFYENVDNYWFPSFTNDKDQLKDANYSADRVAPVLRATLDAAGVDDGDVTDVAGLPTRATLRALGMVERSAADMGFTELNGAKVERVYTFDGADTGIAVIKRVGDSRKGDKLFSLMDQEIKEGSLATDPMAQADILDASYSRRKTPGGPGVSYAVKDLTNKDVFIDGLGNVSLCRKNDPDFSGSDVEWVIENLSGGKGVDGGGIWDARVGTQQFRVKRWLKKQYDPAKYNNWAQNNLSGEDGYERDDSAAGVLKTIGQFNYMNPLVVGEAYNYSYFQMIAGFIGIILVMGVYLNFLFALIQRLLEMVVLYLMSPITLAMYPFDNGSSFDSNFLKPFYKKVIATYAIVLSLNFFFLLYPLVTAIKFFPQYNPGNIIMDLFVTLALMGMLPKVRNTITQVLGAEGLEEKSLKDVAKGGLGELAKGMQGVGVAASLGKAGSALTKVGRDALHNVGLKAGLPQANAKEMAEKKAAWAARRGDKAYNAALNAKGGSAAKAEKARQAALSKADKDWDNSKTKGRLLSDQAKREQALKGNSLLKAISDNAREGTLGKTAKGFADTVLSTFGGLETDARQAKFDKDRLDRLKRKGDHAGEPFIRAENGSGNAEMAVALAQGAGYKGALTARDMTNAGKQAEVQKFLNDNAKTPHGKQVAKDFEKQVAFVNDNMSRFGGKDKEFYQNYVEASSNAKGAGARAFNASVDAAAKSEGASIKYGNNQTATSDGNGGFTDSSGRSISAAAIKDANATAEHQKLNAVMSNFKGSERVYEADKAEKYIEQTRVALSGAMTNEITTQINRSVEGMPQGAQTAFMKAEVFMQAMQGDPGARAALPSMVHQAAVAAQVAQANPVGSAAGDDARATLKSLASDNKLGSDFIREIQKPGASTPTLDLAVALGRTTVPVGLSLDAGSVGSVFGQVGDLMGMAITKTFGEKAKANYNAAANQVDRCEHAIQDSTNDANRSMALLLSQQGNESMRADIQKLMKIMGSKEDGQGGLTDPTNTRYHEDPGAADLIAKLSQSIMNTVGHMHSMGDYQGASAYQDSMRGILQSNSMFATLATEMGKMENYGKVLNATTQYMGKEEAQLKKGMQNPNNNG